jgi:predicted nuclease with TOPRIM domain
MELFVLQHSDASAVEKLDAIARDFPTLGYMLNAIAIQIIELEEAAEKHEATIEELEAKCKKEIEEDHAASLEMIKEAEDDSVDLRNENEELKARLEALEKTDVEALLEENVEILAELDRYKSRHNKMGTADFIEQNQRLFTWANFLAQKHNQSASDINKFTNKYRGIFKHKIESLVVSMWQESANAARELSTITAPVTA